MILISEFIFHIEIVFKPHFKLKLVFFTAAVMQAKCSGS